MYNTAIPSRDVNLSVNYGFYIGHEINSRKHNGKMIISYISFTQIKDKTFSIIDSKIV